MGAFEYQAIDAGGRIQRGVIQADTPRAARGVLRERSLNPLVVRALQSDDYEHPGRWRLRDPNRLPVAQRTQLVRQLATLIEAGLPIDEALLALSEQNDDARARGVSLHLRGRVMEGHSLAGALRDFPQSFSPAFCAAVVAGEASGKLAETLSRLADTLLAQQSLRQQLTLALAYPLLLLLVALAVVTGLMVYVVPQIIGVFDHLGQELPWITRLLVHASQAIRSWGWLLLALVLAAVGAGRWLLRHPPARARIDRALLRVPILGQLLRLSDTAHLTRTLAILVQSGVPVLEAMQLAADTLGNRALRAAFQSAAARVREGSALANAIAENGLFPPLAVRLIASGEKSGRLGTLLGQAAGEQTQQLAQRLAWIAALLGPLVILLVGGVILLIVLAIMLPIFELNQLVR